MFMNIRHYRQIFRNWSAAYTDPMLIDYFCHKSVHNFFYDPPQYNYWWVSYFALGMSCGALLRNMYFNPDIHFRHGDAKRNIVDRWRHHMYSLPYYNHSLRNFAMMFTPSLVDNEPDWYAEHPYGLRPDRSIYYGRYPFMLENPYRYHVDDPNFDYCLHHNVEKRYEAIGYYPDRKKEEDDEE